MKNLKTIGIVFAVLLVVIIIAVVFKDNWVHLLDAFLSWIQGLLGIDAAKQFHFESNVSGTTNGI